jgi:cytochrome c oxidase subunit 1
MSVIAIAFLSTIVWGHHMFISGMNPFLGSVFTFTTLLIAIPSAVKAFNWITTLMERKFTIKSSNVVLYWNGFYIYYWRFNRNYSWR